MKQQRRQEAVRSSCNNMEHRTCADAGATDAGATDAGDAGFTEWPVG